MASGIAKLFGSRPKIADLAWCSSTVEAKGESKFESVCTTDDGGVVAVGYLAGNAPAEVGTGLKLKACSVGTNFLVIKYDPTGRALWASTSVAGGASSSFEAVVADGQGGVYAAGEIWGKQALDLGNGVTVQGGSDHSSILLVHFDKDGQPLWAKSLEQGNGSSKFSAVAVGADGTIFAAGGLTGNDQYRISKKIALSGAASSWTALLIAYNDKGVPQWGATIPEAIHGSFYNDLTVLANGSIIASGSLSGDDPVQIAPHISVKPPNPMSARHYMASGETTGNNTLLVAYAKTGGVVWANTPTGGQGESSFKSVIAVDDLIFAVGYIAGRDSREFGPGVGVAAPGSDIACLTVAFDLTGQAKWARSVEGYNEYSMFNGVCTLGSGLVVAVGRANGQGLYQFGPNASGRAKGSDSNALVVAYDAGGTAKVLHICQSTKGYSVLGSVTPLPAVSNQSIVVAGRVKGAYPYHFGSSVAVRGGFETGQNAVVIAFKHLL